MTRRATFTQAELERAMRAAAKQGKVALRVPGGIAFVDPAAIAQTEPGDDERPNSCDEAWK